MKKIKDRIRNSKHNGLGMYTVAVLFTLMTAYGCVYSFITDITPTTGVFDGVGMLCKDLMPMFTIVIGYYLGSEK